MNSEGLELIQSFASGLNHWELVQNGFKNSAEQDSDVKNLCSEPGQTFGPNAVHAKPARANKS